MFRNDSKKHLRSLKTIDILCKKYDNNYVTKMSYVIVLAYGNFFKMLYSSGRFRNYKMFPGMPERQRNVMEMNTKSKGGTSF